MPRDEDELIAVALGAGERDYPAAVAALVERGGDRIEVAAVALCDDPVPLAQILGVDLLVELTLVNRLAMVNRAVTAIGALIDREPEPEALRAAISAAGNLCDPRLAAPVLRQVAHPDPAVRRAVAMAVPFLVDREYVSLGRAVDALVTLTRDRESSVRDWATTAVGSLFDADSPEIRSALLERLDDTDESTRAEARVGLARRHDPRVLGVVRAALCSPTAGPLDVQCAVWLAEPGLLEPLLALRSAGGEDPEALDMAIARCDPEQQLRAVELGRALLAAADRDLPGMDVRISNDLLASSEDASLELGPEGGPVRSFAGLMAATGGDVEAALSVVVADLDLGLDDGSGPD
jgi:HEAT repeat protein